MEILITRQFAYFETKIFQLSIVNTCFLSSCFFILLDSTPFFNSPIFALVLKSLAFFVSLFHNIPHFLFNSVDIFLSYIFIIEKEFFIDLRNWSHLFNLLVHLRVGEAWLIQFIMPIFSISNQIDTNILLKLLSIFSSPFEYLTNIFLTISIYMEDGCIDELG